MEWVKPRPKPPEPATGVGGWLLVLCALLLVWQPLSLALIASGVVDRIASGGLSLALVLMARLIITAFGIAAGIALASRRPSAVFMARTSLVASAVADIFIYSTSYFPRNRVPGDAPVWITATLIYDGIWLAYLYRSKRVKRTFTEG